MAMVLSDDQVISDDDVSLGEFYIDWTCGPKHTVPLDVPPLTVPASVDKGLYWLGVRLLIDDADPNNNTTGIQDVAPIAVGLSKLVDDVPARFAGGQREFALDVSLVDWCCMGINPSRDYNLGVCEHSDLAEPYVTSQEAGTSRDFVVINGHRLGNVIHFARVGDGTGGQFWAEATWNVVDLSAGVEHLDTIDAEEIHEIYEIDLEAGIEYQLDIDVNSGTADIAAYVFEPTATSGTPADYGWMANNNGAGRGEQLSFTATSSGEHAIVVINENAEAAEYSLLIQP